MSSPHREQVSSVLQRSIQELLTRGLNDPRVRGLISVTKVQVSPDLAQATVFVSILPEEHENTSMKGIISATRFIQTRIGKSVRLRRMPRLTFKLDESLKKQARVHAALQAAAERTGFGVDDAVAPETESDSPQQDPSP